MSRQNVKRVAVALDESVVTNLEGYALGPKLRVVQNIAPQPRDRRQLTWSPGPAPVEAPEAENGDYLDGLCPLGSEGLLIGIDTGGSFGIWRYATGVQLTGGTMGPLAPAAAFAGAAYAYAPPLGHAYISHPGINRIYKCDSTTAANYAPTNAPAGAAAIAYHLDRLHFADRTGSFADTAVWFTDPLVDDPIQPLSFVSIPDEVRAMFRADVGEVDFGAQSHLLYGARTSIWVGDGDPATTTFVRRQLARNRGIVSTSLACETPYGAVVLCTDGQFYIIPAGAVRMKPIGDGARVASIVDGYDRTLDPQQGRPSTLLWSAPYVFYFPSSPDRAGIYMTLDFSIEDEPRWQGPHVAADAFSGVAGGVIDAGAPLTYMVQSTGPAAARRLRDGSLGNAVTADGRTQLIRTGYFYEANRSVRPGRVILRTTSSTVARVITVRAITSDGITSSVAMTVPGRGDAAEDVTDKTVFIFPPQQQRGDFFYLEVEGEAAVDMALRSPLVVEYEVSEHED